MLEKLRLLKKIKVCQYCKCPVLPLFGFWVHTGNECRTQDGLLIQKAEDEVYLEVVDTQLQGFLKQMYGKEDITTFKYPKKNIKSS
jgi:hypothetical protein